MKEVEVEMKTLSVMSVDEIADTDVMEQKEKKEEDKKNIRMKWHYVSESEDPYRLWRMEARVMKHVRRLNKMSSEQIKDELRKANNEIVRRAVEPVIGATFYMFHIEESDDLHMKSYHISRAEITYAAQRFLTEYFIFGSRRRISVKKLREYMNRIKRNLSQIFHRPREICFVGFEESFSGGFRSYMFATHLGYVDVCVEEA